MTELTRNNFRTYNDDEMKQHLSAGREVIEQLKALRAASDFMSIGAVNLLTRVQGFVESSYALAERVQQESADKEGAGQ